MKFGKRLEVETVPEWRIKYIDYKGLKKRLRVVRKEKLTKEKEFHKNKKGADNSRPHSAVVDIHPQTIHNYHLNNVKKFPEKRLSVPVNNDRTFSLQSRTFSMNSVAESVHDFLHKISSALAQKNQNDQIPIPAPITSLETLKDEVEPEERFFFTTLNGEMKKVDKFYKVKEKESLNHFDLLIQQYEILKNMNDEKNKSFFNSETWAKNIVRQSLDYFRPSEEERRLIDYKTAKKSIKKAVFELYRGVELLRAYQTLNYTGFVKILKKYDKISGRNGSNIYMSELKGHHFVNSDVVSKLLNSIEDFYAKNLEGGSRAQAVRKLRVPNNINKTYYSSALLVGLYLGLALPALIYSIDSLVTNEKETHKIWNTKIWNTTIYLGLILPIILLLLMGANMYIWIRLHINYKFIFELNPRDNLDFRQYLELPSIIFLGLSYFIFIYSRHTESTIYPKISVIFISAVLFNPFPIFYYNARRWFIFSAARLLGSGFIRVEFRDFFLADELNSLAYSFVILQLFGCVPSANKSPSICYSKTKSMLFASFLGSIPAFMRLLQCWKRYRDTYQINHMINIGKYASVIVATCFSAIYRTKHAFGDINHNLWWAWVIIQFISSIYTFTWDVKVDWSLLELNSENFLLRNKLGCKYNWLYYYAIISNFLLRFSWILVSIKPSDLRIVSIVAFGEMIRRWQWNFIRVENEHVNNCGNFRAIKDIPLPFPLQTDNDIIAPDLGTSEDGDKDFGNKSSSSFNSFLSKKLFKRRKTRRNSGQSSNDWKDFESKQESIEYNMYTDIYEESDDDEDSRENDTYENITSRGYESDTTYTNAYNAYASRRLPTIYDQDQDQEEKGKQPAFREFRG